MLFGWNELVQRLVDLPRDDQLQARLNGRYIEQEVAALSRSSAVASPEPAEEPGPVSGRVAALNVGRVETMNVYITVVNGGEDDPPLITVQGQ